MESPTSQADAVSSTSIVRALPHHVLHQKKKKKKKNQLVQVSGRLVVQNSREIWEKMKVKAASRSAKLSVLNACGVASGQQTHGITIQLPRSTSSKPTALRGVEAGSPATTVPRLQFAPSQDLPSASCYTAFLDRWLDLFSCRASRARFSNALTRFEIKMLTLTQSVPKSKLSGIRTTQHY